MFISLSSVFVLKLLMSKFVNKYFHERHFFYLIVNVSIYF